MKPIQIIVLCSIAIAIIFFAVSLFQPRQHVFHFNRNYKDSPPLIHDYQTDAVNAAIIRVYHDTMYVFDFGTNALKKYNSGGQLLQTISISDKQKHFGLIKNIDIDAV